MPLPSRKLRRRARAVPLVLGVLLPFSLPGQPSDAPVLYGTSTGGDDVNWEQVARTFASAFVDETAPVPGARLVMPWEPAEAVVIALPLADWNGNDAVRETFLQMLRALLPEIRVVALFRERDYRLLGDFLLSLEADPAIAPHLVRLEPLACETFSIWARDFTPLFARDPDGRLVGIDTSFLATRRLMNLLQNANSQSNPAEQHLRLREASAELQGMRHSDAVPAFLMPYIEARLGKPTALTRAPIYLLGGDFLPVDADRVLVSAETLAENGGRAQDIAATLRKYAGVGEVHFLENLPGDTIEHLDFIAQPIGPDLILVADPPSPFAGDRAYHQYLEAELTARLERNRARLEKAFPSARLVRLPMPAPLLDDEATVVNQLLRECIRLIASRRGLPYWDDPTIGDPLASEGMDPRLAAEVRAQLGLFGWSKPADRAKAVATFLGRPLEDLVRRHVEEHVAYRTYVNSLYVKTPAGRELILVPRFQPAHEAERATIAALEVQVAALYREALPGASLHWIDCTSLTGFLGAVHCLTATIPATTAP